jgi:hypothetical protein
MDGLNKTWEIKKMDLIKQFEKESGLTYPKHDMSAQANFDELYEEWLENKLRWIDISYDLPKESEIVDIIEKNSNRRIPDVLFKAGKFYYSVYGISEMVELTTVKYWYKLPSIPKLCTDAEP